MKIVKVPYSRILTEECPECGEKQVYRDGPYGRFVGCSGFPKCRWSLDTRAPYGSEGDWSIMFNPQETHDYPDESEMIRGF